jgi:hypothetical protein
MTNGYASLIDVNNFFLNQSNVTCFDAAYDSMINTLANISLASTGAQGGRQWTYQTCTEFAFFQTSDDTEQYFGRFPLSLFTDMCEDLFKIDATRVGELVDWTNTYYGGKNVVGTRIVFPNGSIDPWHALSITTSISSNLPAIYIIGTAHCANMYPPNEADSPELKAARIMIENYLSLWLMEDGPI